MERATFWEVFKLGTDGALEPIRRIQIGGVEFGPGVKFSRGVAFGGIDLFQYLGKSLQVEKTPEKWVIRGIYT